MRLLRKIFTNWDGATSAEYAMILAIVGAAIILAAIGLSNAIANGMNDATSNIEQ
jgi:pilus assembly protein Flp/PilA